MYYDLKKVLSYNRPINILIGGRGIGKTYSCKKYVLRKFLKSGEQFVYIRRYDSELESTTKRYLADIIKTDEFSGYEWNYKGGAFTCDSEICGYAMALNRFAHFKSAAYPDVSTIIFDEFIIDPYIVSGALKYLKNEFFIFQDIVETIFRDRENRKIFMLGNAISLANPYLTKLLDKIPNKEFTTTAETVCQIIEPDEEFVKAKRNLSTSSLMAAGGYDQYSEQNQFYLDTNKFIKKLGRKSHCVLTLIYNSKTFGLWINDGGDYTFSSKFQPDHRCLNFDKMFINHKFTKKLNRVDDMFMRHLREIITNYPYSYDSDRTYAEMREVISLII